MRSMKCASGCVRTAHCDKRASALQEESQVKARKRGQKAAQLGQVGKASNSQHTVHSSSVELYLEVLHTDP